MNELIWNKGEPNEVKFNDLQTLIDMFNHWQATGQILQTIKTFKYITKLGLKEAKDWVDENWNNDIGYSVATYLNLIPRPEYIITNVKNDDSLVIKINVIKNIKESSIDELIEGITEQIIKFKKS